MAHVINPLLSGGASGQIGHMFTFDKRGFVRKYVVPANPQSAGQVEARAKLGDIQRELKTLGVVLRAALPASLGYRWNSLLIQYLLNNNAAQWTALTSAYNAFSSGEKSAWATADVATGNVHADGLCLFLAATAVYYVTLAVGGVAEISLPSNSNAATVGAEWVAAT